MQAANFANAVSAAVANAFQYVGRVATNVSQANRWERLSWLTHPSSAPVAGCPTLQARAPPPLASGGIATPEAPTSPAYVPSPFYARGPVVQNYLVPNATEAAGMAAAAATTDAAAAGTSAGPSAPPHTG
ncbi:hypothetical protein Vretifemale_3420, partial [Volvox reticuliferus]